MHMELHVADGDFFLAYPADHEHAGQQEQLAEEHYVMVDAAHNAWVCDADDDVVYCCGRLADITIHGWAYCVAWGDDGVLCLEQNPGIVQG